MRFLLLCLVLLVSALSSAQALELRVALGSRDATKGPGSTAVQSGDVTAFNEELAREICRRLKARCVTFNLPFTEILPGVEANRFELGFGNFLKTPEREKRVAFTDSIWRSSSRLVASQETAQIFAIRAGQDVSLDNLRGARLAVIAESQQYLYLARVAAERSLSLHTGQTIAEVIALVRQGKVDFGLLPMLAAYGLLSSEPPAGIGFVGAPVTEGTLGGTVHIALPKPDSGLRLAVNQAIAAMRADGTYHRIVRRHFPFTLD